MKKYLDINVYEATQARLKYIFDNFDNIYVSFSGGKDSGLLLNMVLDYKRRNNIQKKIGVFHQDFEAQYQTTTDYVTRMFENNINDIEPYWVCIPKCIGIHGIRIKKPPGCALCLSRTTLSSWKTITLIFINIKCRRKIFMQNLADGMPDSMKGRQSACWAFAPMNP